MFSNFLGLPMHPLVVHATVVLLPLTALLLIAAAVNARVRRWAGWLLPALGVLTLVLSFVAKESGEALEHRVGESALLEAHAELGDTLPLLAALVALCSVALYVLHRGERRHLDAAVRDDLAGATAAGRPASRRSPLLTAVAVLSVLAGLAGIVQVARVGHSGAEAVWSDTPAVSTSGQHGGDGD